MKNEILNIAEALKTDAITSIQAKSLLLNLFDNYTEIGVDIGGPPENDKTVEITISFQAFDVSKPHIIAPPPTWLMFRKRPPTL